MAPMRRTAWSWTLNPKAAMAATVNQRFISRKTSAGLGSVAQQLLSCYACVAPLSEVPHTAQGYRWTGLLGKEYGRG